MKHYPVFLVNNIFVAAHNKAHAAGVVGASFTPNRVFKEEDVLDTPFTHYDTSMLMMGKIFNTIKGIPTFWEL